MEKFSTRKLHGASQERSAAGLNWVAQAGRSNRRMADGERSRVTHRGDALRRWIAPRRVRALTHWDDARPFAPT
jgi:hypothetical protein